MEQTPSLPGRSPELPSVSSPSDKERANTFSTPEHNDGSAPERQEQRTTTAPTAEQATAPPAVLPMPVSVASDAGDALVPSAASDPPSIANDDDLIEKEWVDKAKKVIAETKDDPYRREQEVNRLQADYLAKRYGRQLGSQQ